MKIEAAGFRHDGGTESFVVLGHSTRIGDSKDHMAVKFFLCSPEAVQDLIDQLAAAKAEAWTQSDNDGGEK